MKDILNTLAEGGKLDFKVATNTFETIMSGDASPTQIGAFLMALRIKGESVSDITAGATVLRSKMLKLESPAESMDIVGTGGDKSGSLNISTATAIIVAGCGVPIAKHGNRAMSSKCGSADVLKELGVNIECNLSLVKESLFEAGLCFMLAPIHHSAMKYVGPSRVELGTRSIFNLLGPLSNPASVTKILLGVFSKEWVDPLAKVLKELGTKSAWVVHGADGLDEITLTGATYVSELKNGKISSFEINPQDAGLENINASEIKGDDPKYNANALLALLDGHKTSFRNVVLMNSAAALIVANKASSLTEGVTLAEESIDKGNAKLALDKMISITNGEFVD